MKRIEEIAAFIAGLNSKALLLCVIWLSCLLSALARSGMRDAFLYKKTKRQKKTEWSFLPFQKKILLLPSSLKPTNAPYHMRLFWNVRLCNGILILCIGIMVALSETVFTGLKLYTNILILAKLILFDFLFTLYGIFTPSGNTDSIKGWNFDSCKKP